MDEPAKALDDRATIAPTTNRLSRLFTRLGKYSSIACVVVFVALMATVFSVREPEEYSNVIAAAVAFAFLSGGASVGSYFLRELLTWKRNHWRYGVRHLICWMTAVALVLAMLMYALSSH